MILEYLNVFMDNSNTLLVESAFFFLNLLWIVTDDAHSTLYLMKNKRAKYYRVYVFVVEQEKYTRIL